MKYFTRSVFACLALSLFAATPTFAAITLFAKASNPADNGALTDAAAQTVTPPAGMHAGDFVYLVAMARSATATLSLADIGGQAWTVKSQQGVNGQGVVRAFTTRFNGTWSANPAVQTDEKTGVGLTIVMLVFRPTAGANTWVVDAAQATAFFSAPASPFDVTANGATTTAASTVTVATFVTPDDNSWVVQTGGWSSPGGTTQFRNTTGNDSSLSLTYQIRTTAGSTGNVTNRQTANGGDAGRWLRESFAEVTTVVAKKWHPGHGIKDGVDRAFSTVEINALNSLPNFKFIDGIVTWGNVEPTMGHYDWTPVTNLLNQAKASGKKLFLSIAWKKFNTTDPSGIMPSDMMGNPLYNNGYTATGSSGFCANLWVPAVTDTYIAMLQALAAQFDDDSALEMVYGSESTPSLSSGNGYARPTYAAQLKRIYAGGGDAFKATNYAALINFLSGEVTGLIESAYQAKIGMADPDSITTTAAYDLFRGVNHTGEDPAIRDYRGLIPHYGIASAPTLGGKDDNGPPSNVINWAQGYGITHESWVIFQPSPNSLSDIQSAIVADPTLGTACPLAYTQGCNTN